MKCFDQVDPWPSKVNYIDASNRVLGFDMSASCCEDFGHGVYLTIPASTDEPSVPSLDLTPYSFADEEPTACLPNPGDEGGGLAFRITAHGLADRWVVIWNHHNGYYSHGWSFCGQEGDL